MTAIRASSPTAPGSSFRSRLECFLLHPLLLFVITAGLRAILFSSRHILEPYIAYPVVPHPSLGAVTGTASTVSAYTSANGKERQASPPPIHFSIWGPLTEAASWREAVYWRSRGFSADLPYYLQALVPWYTVYIPAVLACPPVSGLVLSMLDGLTAVMISRAPCTSTALLYAFFVLNPLSVLATVYESLTALELFLMTAAVYGCAGRHRTYLAWALAIVAALVLGSSFMAVMVALVAPIGTASKSLAFGAAAALMVACGAASVLYLVRTADTHQATSLYAPPDNGALWYVRQLVLAPFARCLEMLLLQLAPMLTIPMTVVFPTAYVQAAQGRTFPAMYADTRVFLVLFAEALSVLFRTQLTLPYCFVIVLLFYAWLNPSASKEVALEDGRKLTYPVHGRVRLLVPIFMVLISVPLQMSFYAGWVLRETANANWKFFSDAGFTVGVTMFLVLWFAEVVEDAITCRDKAAPEGREPALTKSKTE